MAAKQSSSIEAVPKQEMTDSIDQSTHVRWLRPFVEGVSKCKGRRLFVYSHKVSAYLSAFE